VKEVASNKEALRKRIKRFLESLDQECLDFFNNIKKECEVSIYGGLVRDFCIGGAKNFKSDIDLVADISPVRLEQIVNKFSPHKNKFGGFRLEINKRKIDIWPLESTWAIQQGYAKKSFDALLETTFFDWDAALYKLNDNSLLTISDYVSKIRKKTLSLNLKENPNPTGATVRALRFVKAYNPSVSVELAEFLLTSIKKNGATCLCSYEKQSYDRSLISEDFVNKTVTSIEMQQNKPNNGFFSLVQTPFQMSLI